MKGLREMKKKDLSKTNESVLHMLTLFLYFVQEENINSCNATKKWSGKGKYKCDACVKCNNDQVWNVKWS